MVTREHFLTPIMHYSWGMLHLVRCNWSGIIMFAFECLCDTSGSCETAEMALWSVSRYTYTLRKVNGGMRETSHMCCLVFSWHCCQFIIALLASDGCSWRKFVVVCFTAEWWWISLDTHAWKKCTGIWLCTQQPCDIWCHNYCQLKKRQFFGKVVYSQIDKSQRELLMLDQTEP